LRRREAPRSGVIGAFDFECPSVADGKAGAPNWAASVPNKPVLRAGTNYELRRQRALAVLNIIIFTKKDIISHSQRVHGDKALSGDYTSRPLCSERWRSHTGWSNVIVLYLNFTARVTCVSAVGLNVSYARLFTNRVIGD